MKKITKAQQEKLLTLYPDAEAIGRTFIQDLLNRNNRENDDPKKHTPTLSIEEIIFLRDRLPQNEKVIYEEYLELQEMLARLINKVMLIQQSFHHGFYRVLYFIQPLLIGLKAYCNCPDLNNEEHHNMCQDQIKLVENGLKTIWESYVMKMIRIMHIYDVHINILTEVSQNKFDYTVISPAPIRFGGDIKAVQNTMLELSETIDEYRVKMRGKKNKIKISRTVNQILNELGHEEVIDDTTLKQLKKIVDAFNEEEHKIIVEKNFDRYFIRDMIKTIK